MVLRVVLEPIGIVPTLRSSSLDEGAPADRRAAEVLLSAGIHVQSNLSPFRWVCDAAALPNTL